MHAPISRRSHAGFTLIEVLVALAITSLVMTLLMGATYYVLQVRVKLANEVDQGEREARQQLWFRQVVASLQPVEREAPDNFEGDEQSFHGLAVQSLRAESDGAPEMVTFSLKRGEQGQTTLIYQAGDTQTELASWPNAKAAFSYQDQTGKLGPSWNAAQRALERIPLAIELKVSNRNTDAPLDYWFALVNSKPWLRPSTPPPFQLPSGN